MKSTSQLYDNTTNDITRTAVYFVILLIATWLFIQSSSLYDNLSQQLLSGSIAGAKWMIQIVAAFVLLREKKWAFIKWIGFTCMIGSLLLIPYCIGSVIGVFNDDSSFLFSLSLSVASMIALYIFFVLMLGLSKKWWYAWLICLAIAITLQLTVVFHLI